jgi:hypothetical protein
MGGEVDIGTGLANDSRTPPPPWAKVRKVFEVDILGLDLDWRQLDFNGW